MHPRQYTGVTCNSKKVKPGFAFVAIRGFKHDGNQYIEEACNRGARVIFTETPPAEDLPIPVIKVRNARKKLAELLCSHYNHPSRQMLVCGITGTNGKTTTTNLLYHLYREQGGRCGLIGTIGTMVGEEIIPPGLTTPDAEQLQKYLAEMVRQGNELAVMEVSSHGIKLDRIWGIDFDLAVITNISRDHFDLHSSFAEYLETKKSFLMNLKNQAIVFINVDDHKLSAFRPEITSRTVSYAINNQDEADAWIGNIRYSPSGTSFRVVVKNRLPGIKEDVEPVTFSCQLGTPGIHNLYNALPSILSALSLGISIPDIKKGLASFPGVWRRLQVIHRGEFTAIDDCAHNPGSYSAVFAALNSFKYRRLIVVNAIRGNRGVKINVENARVIAGKLKKEPNRSLLITSCTDVAREDDRVSSKEKKAFLQVLKEYGIPFTFYQQLDPALEQAIEEAEENDLILLLGAHAMDDAAGRFKKKLRDLLRTGPVLAPREEDYLPVHTSPLP